MNPSILIVGYGNIGKHVFNELKKLNPDVYDKYKQSTYDSNKIYDFAFICVPTEKNIDDSCDTSIVEEVVRNTKANIIIIKSTIPPKTTERLINETHKNIIFSPESYGVTQHCKEDPGFVILGGDKKLTAEVAQLYYKVKSGYYKFYFTDSTTAELFKYMLNSYLALKVTFCNEFKLIADEFNVSYPELRELFIADDRVGESHTFALADQPYYDSHCFNKDVPAITKFTDKCTLIKCMNQINKQFKNNK